ncbi:YihY/virulence factor BrkB family protein [bacterium]|nr:YihY/virulence factor BrkB family protein [bacterium]
MRFLRAIFRVLMTLFHRLGHERCPEAAASIGFYAVFSMFPLLLILVAVGTRFLETADAQERLLKAVLRFMPVSRELIQQNVLAVVRARGAVGGLSAIGLVWASTSAFSTLVRNLNRAWPMARPRNLFGERLLALFIVVCLFAVVLLYLVAKALVNLPGDWEVAQRAAAWALDLIPIPSAPALSLFMLVILTMLYRWLPRTSVLWREALAGAATSSLALWGATTLFTRFLASGLARYNLIYGSLGAFLALLSWVYIASLIMLGGAHVGAAIAANTRHAIIEEEEGAAQPADSAECEPASEH